MATAASGAQTPEKKSKLPLLIGLVLALAAAGGGFFVTYSGGLDSLFGAAEGDGAAAAAEHGQAPVAPGTQPASAVPGSAPAGATGGVGFVPLDPITVNLGARGGEARHLRFSAQLEVAPGNAVAVQALMPRIMDVLNIYLRALDPPELEEPSALLRLRAQMLRRVQIVTGPGMVNDLLIIEFVFN
ncbi:MAG: flagellar basal body-associated protein FliL [Pararhodobacter sp.]